MRLSRSDLVLTLFSVSAAAGLTVAGGFGAPELVFFAVLLTSLGLVAREAWRARRGERAARHDALEVSRIRPDQVADDAVRDERRRLSEDIAAELRWMLTQVRVEATQSDDPGATARSIHRHARLASSELRRLLGLLRANPGKPVEVGPARDDVVSEPSGRDLALGGAAGLVAVMESVGYQRAEGLGLDWWAVTVTVSVAVTVVGRSVSPALAAVLAAAVVSIGAASGHGPTGGFWMLITVTGLAWGTIGAPEGPLRRAGAGFLLAATLIASAWASDRENAGATTVVVGVLVAVALLVRVERTRAQRAMTRAAHHRSSLAQAAATAVEADRATYAREIHDSVSHAVGLIAMQAGAAEVTARRDPQAAIRALELISAAASEALTDLDRLRAVGAGERTSYDVAALVARIRAAGTPVSASGLDLLPTTLSTVVYRIVQEALTNAVRHAAGAPASVRVDVDATSLTITIKDSGPGPRPSSGHGFGLVGLAERVRHAGGTLRVGARAEGRGFVVEATLPTSRSGVR